jgi:uncharacterized OsmC-like protein
MTPTPKLNGQSENIKRAFERNAHAVKLRPGIGRLTGITKVSLPSGTRCEIDAGDWKFVCDVAESSGGTNEGPDPGPFGRGALGACLAIGYRTQAAIEGIDLGKIEVEVEADLDAAGYYGVAEVAPGYLAVRCNVTVESEASEEEIRKVLDAAEKHSPWLDNFTRGLAVKRNLKVSTPA